MERIGFVGLGVMGVPMCSHLMNEDTEVYIYSRTASKAASLMGNGAIWCETAEEVARNADIIMTIVGYPSDVEEVYMGSTGLLKAAHEGQLYIDMTTTKPSLDIAISEQLRMKGAGFMDAPVSGGDVGARNASLSIMVGGSDEDYERALPVLGKLGTNITHLGPVGAGQHTKMCNQIVIAGTMIGVSEALVYAEKAGLDLEKMIATISRGAAGCWTLDNLAPRVVRDDMDPGFMIDHFIKDMGIAIEESDRMGLDLEGLKLVRGIYQSLQDKGKGRCGTQALVEAIRENAR